MEKIKLKNPEGLTSDIRYKIEKNLLFLFSFKIPDFLYSENKENSKKLEKIKSFEHDEKKGKLKITLKFPACPYISDIFLSFENDLYVLRLKTRSSSQKTAITFDFSLEKIIEEDFNITSKYLKHKIFLDDESRILFNAFSSKYYDEEYSRDLEFLLNELIPFEQIRKEDLIKNKGRHPLFVYRKKLRGSDIILNLLKTNGENIKINQFFKILSFSGVKATRKKQYELVLVDSMNKKVKVDKNLINEVMNNFLHLLEYKELIEKNNYLFKLWFYSEDFSSEIGPLFNLFPFSISEVEEMINKIKENEDYLNMIIRYHNKENKKNIFFNILIYGLLFNVVNKKKISIREDIKDINIFQGKIKHELKKFILENAGKNKEIDEKIYKMKFIYLCDML